MIKNIINKMLKLNNKAINNGDIPVSCIIVKENIIIAQTYNKKYKNNDPLAHAEILAIKKAAKVLNTCNLSDCELYVSLKPCNMCKEVIKEARIKKVYYILDNKKEVNDTTKYIKIECLNEDLLSKQLIDFFVDKR